MELKDYIRANWVFFKQIYNDEKVLIAVREELNNNGKKVLKASDDILDGKWTKLVGKPPIFILTSLVLCLKSAYDKFIRLGLSEHVFYDTMADIKVWGEDYRAHHNGEIGLTEINWLHLHVNCEIFKIGRLQFQISKYYFGKLYEKNGTTIKYGERCYNIHIPRGAKLDTVSCKKSIELALDVLGDIFKDIRKDIMICDSWLLSPKNKNFMKPDSNIIKFANMFDIVEETAGAEQHFRWLFDIIETNKALDKNKKKLGYYYNLNNYNATSSMQKAAIDYVMAGGELTGAKGILKTRNII